MRVLWIALLVAGFAPAQDQPPEPVTQGETEQDQQEPQPAYPGPVVLGRDASLFSQRQAEFAGFRVYAEITGVYDSGLTPGLTDSHGNLIPARPDHGLETGFGASVARQWKRDRIRVEYKGKYLHYQNSPFLDGMDQFLNLSYSRILTRNLTLDVNEKLGSTTLANGEFAYLPLTTTDLFAVPTNELFDNRTTYLESRVDLTWQKSARLSIGFGGDGFLVRRQSLALAGLNGFTARASIVYRLTRRQTVAASYGFTYYDFQRAFGGSTLQSAQLGYSIGLTRRWDLATAAGGIRVETRGLTEVPIDPAIAAIIGQNFATVTFFRVVSLPIAEAQLIRRFDRASMTLGYSSGVTPGNGVYLTSRQTSGTATYNYTGYQRLNLRVSAGYNQLSTLGQSLGKFTNFQGGTGVAYRLARDTYMQARYDYRHYTTESSIFQKDSNRVSLGLAFSPGERPLAIW